MESPRILVRDAGGFSGVWREVHMDEWTVRSNAEQLKRRFDAQLSWMRELPPHRRLLTVTFVAAEAVTPLEGELRELVAQNVKMIQPHLKGAAIVLNVPGFKGALFRSIVAGMNMLSKNDYPTTTEATIEGAIRWAAPMLDAEGGKQPTYDDLLAAWNELVASR